MAAAAVSATACRSEKAQPAVEAVQPRPSAQWILAKEQMETGQACENRYCIGSSASGPEGEVVDVAVEVGARARATGSLKCEAVCLRLAPVSSTKRRRIMKPWLLAALMARARLHAQAPRSTTSHSECNPLHIG